MLRSRLKYNQLRMRALEEDVDAPRWMLEDYRKLSWRRLQQDLQALGVVNDLGILKASCESVESFEQWYAVLIQQGNFSTTDQEHLWLVAFEVWRRFYPEQQSFETLCDDIDDMIFRYETGSIRDEQVQDLLHRIVELIEQQSRSKRAAKQMFAALDASCAHGLELFIYDYIDDQIHAQASSCAIDLLDHFQDLVQEDRWLQFLRARLAPGPEVFSAFMHLLSQFDQDRHSSDIELAFEILAYLCECNLSNIFAKYCAWLMRQKLDKEEEEDLCDLIDEYLHNHKEDKFLPKMLKNSFPPYNQLLSLNS